jgi:histone deacetylase 1/2
MFVTIYVHDIIVTGSSNHAITALLRDLNKKFAIKDLGDLHYFLGIEVKKVKSWAILIGLICFNIFILENTKINSEIHKNLITSLNT